MFLVDTHCHLSFSPLVEDLDGVIARAAGRGVRRVIAPAYDMASWAQLAGIGRPEAVSIALGVHPWRAEDSADFKQLERRVEGGEAAAIGEIGLDFKVDGVRRERQVEVLRRQLDIAAGASLPVLLHCRGAFEELIAILSEYEGKLRGAIHAFSRGPELAARFVDAGMHIAFGGVLTRPRAARVHRAAQSLPAEVLLLETDAPSIGLEGVPPERVEPHHVRDVAEALASCRRISVEEAAAITTENAASLFGFRSVEP